MRLQELRYAIRGLLRTPGFTIAALVTLTIAIAANSAILAIVDAAMYAPLPFPDADRLVALRGQLRQQFPSASVTPADFVDYRNRSKSFESLAATMPTPSRVTVAGSGEPEQARALLVTGNFFDTLGVRPILGRGLRVQDEHVARPLVAVLSHGFWIRRFGGDQGIIGRQVAIDGTACEIVGVMPEGLEYPAAVDAWAPLPFLATGFDSRSAHFLRPIGRLKLAATLAQAQAELDIIAGSLAREYPATNDGWQMRGRTLRDQLLAGPARPMLRIIAGAVLFVLVLSCANVSGLFLTRNRRRRHEMAVRLSLGASRWQVMRLVVIESGLLAATAAVFGIALSTVAGDFVKAAVPGVPAFLGVESLRLGILTSLLSAAAAVCVGVAPSLQATRDPHGSLKESSRQMSRGSLRFHGGLAISQLVLAITLLYGTGLLAYSFLKLTAVSTGFEPHGVSTMRLSLPSAKYKSPEPTRIFHASLIERLEAIQGIESATLVDTLPLGDLGNDNQFTIRERSAEATRNVSADDRSVDARYFETLRIPIVRGRPFTRQESRSGALVAIVSEQFAELFISGDDPIGKHLVTGDSTYEIIGVSGDVRHRDLGVAPYQTMYRPAIDVSETTLVVRSTLDDGRLSETIRGIVRQLDRDVPVSPLRTMDAVVETSIHQRRLTTWGLVGFSGFAMLLAALGIYGVVALSVTDRTKEIGIRTALGATAHDVRRLVVGQGIKLTLAGIAVGMPLALLVARGMSALLFEVRSYDPLVFAITTVALGLVALAGCYVPVQRATRINPALLLRID